MMGFTHYHFVAVILNNDDFMAWDLYGDCVYVRAKLALGKFVVVNDAELLEVFVCTCRLNHNIRADTLKRKPASIESFVVRVSKNSARGLRGGHTHCRVVPLHTLFFLTTFFLAAEILNKVRHCYFKSHLWYICIIMRLHLLTTHTCWNAVLFTTDLIFLTVHGLTWELSGLTGTCLCTVSSDYWFPRLQECIFEIFDWFICKKPGQPTNRLETEKQFTL